MAVAVVYPASRGSVVDDLWLFTVVTGQAITTDAISSDVLDLGADRVDSTSPIDLGTGTPMRIKIVVTAAFSGGTSLNVQLQASEDAALSSAVTLSETGVLASAKWAAGKEFYLDIPPGIKLDRYLGLNFVDVGAHSAGKIACFLHAL